MIWMAKILGSTPHQIIGVCNMSLVREGAGIIIGLGMTFVEH
jgi:hypothetical protein